MKSFSVSTLRFAVIALASSTLLSACGGGDSPAAPAVTAVAATPAASAASAAAPAASAVVVVTSVVKPDVVIQGVPQDLSIDGTLIRREHASGQKTLAQMVYFSLTTSATMLVWENEGDMSGTFSELRFVAVSTGKVVPDSNVWVDGKRMYVELNSRWYGQRLPSGYAEEYALEGLIGDGAVLGTKIKLKLAHVQLHAWGKVPVVDVVGPEHVIVEDNDAVIPSVTQGYWYSDQDIFAGQIRGYSLMVNCPVNCLLDPQNFSEVGMWPYSYRVGEVYYGFINLDGQNFSNLSRVWLTGQSDITIWSQVTGARNYVELNIGPLTFWVNGRRVSPYIMRWI